MIELEVELNRQRAEVLKNCKARGVPEHMIPSLLDYLIEGRVYGSFLRAVLRNDLCEAAFHADGQNIASWLIWARTMYNDLPSPAWGTSEKVLAWIKGGGLRGDYERRLKERMAEKEGGENGEDDEG